MALEIPPILHEVFTCHYAAAGQSDKSSWVLLKSKSCSFSLKQAAKDVDLITVSSTQQPGKMDTFTLIITWTLWPLPQLHWTSIQHHCLLILEYLMIKTAFCFQSQSPPFVFSIHNKWKELIPFLARSCCQSTVDRESALRQLRRVLHLSPTGTTASVHKGRIRWLISVKRSASPPMVPPHGRITFYIQRQVFHKYKNKKDRDAIRE